MSESGIGIIILAAGRSLRFGKPKQLLKLEEKSLLRRCAEAAIDCECENVMVVLGFEAEVMASELGHLPVKIVRNENWAEGMSSSIKTGLARLRETSSEIAAVIIMLCDQPFVDQKTIKSLVDTYRSSGNPIVAAEYDGIAGVPALFGSEMFDELMKLEGDTGARAVIRRNLGENVSTIPAPEAAFDLDTPSDLQQLL